MGWTVGDGTVGRDGMAGYHLPWHPDAEPLGDTLYGQNPDTSGATTAAVCVCIFGRAPLVQHLPGEPSALLRDFRSPYVGDRNGKRGVNRRQLISAHFRRLSCSDLSPELERRLVEEGENTHDADVKVHGGEAGLILADEIIRLQFPVPCSGCPPAI